jgi:hypothetical protein
LHAARQTKIVAIATLAVLELHTVTIIAARAVDLTCRSLVR